ncbi:hypothetical protein C8R46DRAFT_1046081 [Mycena filopes]|nr:hypothetical protein C8R46DRAFT_1046081 [Mycena filopes]
MTRKKWKECAYSGVDGLRCAPCGGCEEIHEPHTSKRTRYHGPLRDAPANAPAKKKAVVAGNGRQCEKHVLYPGVLARADAEAGAAVGMRSIGHETKEEEEKSTTTGGAKSRSCWPRAEKEGANGYSRGDTEGASDPHEGNEDDDARDNCALEDFSSPPPSSPPLSRRVKRHPSGSDWGEEGAGGDPRLGVPRTRIGRWGMRRRRQLKSRIMCIPGVVVAVVGGGGTRQLERDEG